MSDCIEIVLFHGHSPKNLLHICKTPFQKNTSGKLLSILLKKQLRKKNINSKDFRFWKHKQIINTRYVNLNVSFCLLLVIIIIRFPVIRKHIDYIKSHNLYRFSGYFWSFTTLDFFTFSLHHFAMASLGLQSVMHIPSSHTLKLLPSCLLANLFLQSVLTLNIQLNISPSLPLVMVVINNISMMLRSFTLIFNCRSKYYSPNT